uniref:Protein phosphatase 1 regulatory inhibitor subunit 1C n=1 Tax=Monodelphis domestica TaxID=13616 RepID=A0A5F8H6N7_MONDO
MEPNSPKKIQFAVPLFQSQIAPEAAEQIRKRRPTPASLVILNEHNSPEIDEKKVTNSQGEIIHRYNFNNCFLHFVIRVFSFPSDLPFPIMAGNMILILHVLSHNIYLSPCLSRCKRHLSLILEKNP